MNDRTCVPAVRFSLKLQVTGRVRAWFDAPRVRFRVPPTQAMVEEGATRVPWELPSATALDARAETAVHAALS